MVFLLICTTDDPTSQDVPLWSFHSAPPLRIHQNSGGPGGAIAHTAGEWQRSFSRAQAHYVEKWFSIPIAPVNTLWFAPYLCHVDTHPWPVVSKFLPLLLLHGSCRIWNIANQVLFRDNFKVPRLLFSIENYVFRNWPKHIIGNIR